MIGLILTIAIVGVIVWFIENYLPMAAPFKTVIRVLVVIGLILYLANYFGYADLPMPRRR